MARYHIETYGCTANRGESREIERALRDAGHERVGGAGNADVAILNTCTVVEKTERNMLRRAEELDQRVPELIVTGCMALAQGEEFERANVDARVLGWDEVPGAVRNGECPTPAATGTSGTDGTGEIGGMGDGSAPEPILDGTIGILPIARGCMSDCSYCITKRATGKIDSPPIEENIEKARALVHAGAKEIRVTGQDTGVYGWEEGERKLHRLLERICAIDGDFRVRVGMANPKGVHGIREELAQVFAANEKLYNFLHAPVQSGSDEVLGAMRRQHQVEEFREVIETFDAYLDHWTLATDFIVGFPTESDADHEKSLALLEATRPEKINVTRFSKRPGTDAANMKGLGGTLKKERSKELTDAKMDVVGGAHEAMVGTNREVLAIEEGTGESVKCYDEAYRQVIVQNAPTHGIEPGDFADVEITSHNTVYAFGEPV